MPPRKGFVHEVTPGVVERMTLETMLPDGPHASLRSDWAGAVEEVTPIPSPLSLFSFPVSALPLSALTLGVVYDSKELSGKNHWLLNTGMGAGESLFPVTTDSVSWLLGRAGPQSSCPLASLI